MLQHPTEIFIELQISVTVVRTHVHIFHENRTFYFSPVDRHLCYGDFKTLGDIQELHIKGPVSGNTRVHNTRSTGAFKFSFFKPFKKHTAV